jgi:hypothetical protein
MAMSAAAVPAADDGGVPVSAPVLALKLAQAGRFTIVNFNAFPDGSETLGVKEYATPTLAFVDGLPEIARASAA